MLAFVSIAPEDHWEHMSPELAPLIRMIEARGLRGDDQVDRPAGRMRTKVEAVREKLGANRASAGAGNRRPGR